MDEATEKDLKTVTKDPSVEKFGLNKDILRRATLSSIESIILT